MKQTQQVNKIVLLDRERKDTDAKRLQRSAQETIESGNYEWQMVTISEDGEINYK